MTACETNQWSSVSREPIGTWSGYSTDASRSITRDPAHPARMSAGVLLVVDGDLGQDHHTKRYARDSVASTQVGQLRLGLRHQPHLRVVHQAAPGAKPLGHCMALRSYREQGFSTAITEAPAAYDQEPIQQLVMEIRPLLVENDDQGEQGAGTAER